MENGSSKSQEWQFKPNEILSQASAIIIRGVLNMLFENLDSNDSRPVIPLGHGDPSAFPSFRTDVNAENVVCNAVKSSNFNGYGSTVGIPPARTACSVKGCILDLQEMARKKIREYESTQLLKDHFKMISGFELEIKSAQVYVHFCHNRGLGHLRKEISRYQGY